MTPKRNGDETAVKKNQDSEDTESAVSHKMMHSQLIYWQRLNFFRGLFNTPYAPVQCVEETMSVVGLFFMLTSGSLNTVK